MNGMKFYRVFNGYTGYSSVYCLVAAPDEETARQLACQRFKGDSDERPERLRYKESYWTDLEVEELAGPDKPWVGGPYD